MKYKFHDKPPDFTPITEGFYEDVDERQFKKEVAFLADYLGIKQDRIRICGDHPVGEDVIYVDNKYSGYLDFEFYSFMDAGLDMYGSFAEWKEGFK